MPQTLTLEDGSRWHAGTAWEISGLPGHTLIWTGHPAEPAPKREWDGFAVGGGTPLLVAMSALTRVYVPGDAPAEGKA
jgi:hypothetical protein